MPSELCSYSPSGYLVIKDSVHIQPKSKITTAKKFNKATISNGHSKTADPILPVHLYQYADDRASLPTLTPKKGDRNL